MLIFSIGWIVAVHLFFDTGNSMISFLGYVEVLKDILIHFFAFYLLDATIFATFKSDHTFHRNLFTTGHKKPAVKHKGLILQLNGF